MKIYLSIISTSFPDEIIIIIIIDNTELTPEPTHYTHTVKKSLGVVGYTGCVMVDGWKLIDSTEGSALLNSDLTPIQFQNRFPFFYDYW